MLVNGPVNQSVNQLVDQSISQSENSRTFTALGEKMRLGLAMPNQCT